MFRSHLTLDDVERSLGVSVQDERRQNRTEAVELCQFELVCQGGGGDAGQRTDAGKRPGCDQRIRDLTWHHCCFRKKERDVNIFVDHAWSFEVPFTDTSAYAIGIHLKKHYLLSF